MPIDDSIDPGDDGITEWAEALAELYNRLETFNPAVQTYTPTLTAATSNPVLSTNASHFADGRYARIGDWVLGWAAIRFGDTGRDAGSGRYRISLPLPADTDMIPASGPTMTSHYVGQAYLTRMGGTDALDVEGSHYQYTAHVPPGASGMYVEMCDSPNAAPNEGPYQDTGTALNAQTAATETVCPNLSVTVIARESTRRWSFHARAQFSVSGPTLSGTGITGTNLLNVSRAIYLNIYDAVDGGAATKITTMGGAAHVAQAGNAFQGLVTVGADSPVLNLAAGTHVITARVLVEDSDVSNTWDMHASRLVATPEAGRGPVLAAEDRTAFIDYVDHQNPWGWAAQTQLAQMRVLFNYPTTP